MFKNIMGRVPIPCSTNTLERISTIAGGSSQKLMLFRRGNAITDIIGRDQASVSQSVRLCQTP